MIKKYFYINKTGILIIVIDNLDKIDSIKIDKNNIYIYDINKNLLDSHNFQFNLEEGINRIIFANSENNSKTKIFKIL